MQQSNVSVTLSSGTNPQYKRRLYAVWKFRVYGHFRTRDPSPGIRTNLLPVVHVGGITQCAGDVISFGIIGISEIDRSLP
jgi:hypothetical protein